MKNTSKTIFGASKNILRDASHFVNVGVKVAASVLTADENGNKILKAGTVVTAAGALMADADANATSAFGLVYEDMDLTFGDDTVPVVIHGIIESSLLDVVPTAAQKSAMKGLLFV